MSDLSYRFLSQVISSRYTNYLNAASLTVLLLEYLQTLRLEITLIWPTRWNAMKCVYFINRYLPFLTVTLLIFYNVAPILPEETCKVLFSVPSMGIAVSILISEVILYLRIYALSGRSRPIFIFLAIHGTVVIVTCITFFAYYLAVGKFVPSLDPDIIGCFGRTSGGAKYVLICFVMLLYGGIVPMSLSVWFGVRMYWYQRRSHLIQIFYRDGTFYFVTISIMSISNGIVSSIAPAKYRFLMAVPQAVVHNTLANRMILHLRESARLDMGFTTPNISDDLDISHDFHATVGSFSESKTESGV